MDLEAFGKILVAGFGDKVLIGIFMSRLEKSTPEGCYEWIRDNRSLLEGVSDSDWRKIRQVARNINIDDITTEDIITTLRENRLDILGVILNHPQGRSWLDKQVVEIKKNLKPE